MSEKGIDAAPSREELAAFRAETRAWLEENCPAGVRDLPPGTESFWGGRNPVYPSLDHKIWFERMRDKHWIVPDWPVKYGGGGLDKHRAGIVQQELARIKAAPALQSFGIWMLGPALLKFGTEEQKLEHLPRVTRGAIRWCQGYSEPGAGSDLAGVQTRGEDKGDHFLVNGSKIWTSSADKGDMIFALVRTEPDAPKHQGISFLLADMADPGISTRPIKMISGDSFFCQTFFDNVKVSKDNVVGGRGKGWDVAKYLLIHERQMIGSSMGARLNKGPATLAKEKLGVDGLRREAGLRQAVVGYEIDFLCMDIAVERMRDLTKVRQAPPHLPNVLKLLGTELNYRRTELAMTLGGEDALDAGTQEAHEWLAAPANCIAGGSNEVQLNIIAKSALGLPELKGA